MVPRILFYQFLIKEKGYEILLNWSPQGNCFDIRSNSLEEFFKDIMVISLENLKVDNEAFKNG